MKSFTFPLESVLQTRAAQEDEARLQLAQALKQQHEAAARVDDAVQTVDRLLQFMSQETAGRFSVSHREQSWAMHRAQEQICAGLRAAVEACARITEEKRAAVLEARRNRELLERLKAKRQSSWQHEATRSEQHQLDDFAMTRRHQTAQLEAVHS